MGLRVGVAPALNSWPMAIRVLAVKYPDASLRLRDAVQGRGEGFMARDPIQLETLRRLVHEERLRAELTAEITAKLEKERAVATWPARLWTFFNSPLGVIVFSSVLIASVGKFYSDYRSEQIEINARRTEAMKLATEYDRRLNAVRSVALDVLEAKGRQVGGSPPTVRLPDEAKAAIKGIWSGSGSGPTSKEFEAIDTTQIVRKLDLTDGVSGEQRAPCEGRLNDLRDPASFQVWLDQSLVYGQMTIDALYHQTLPMKKHDRRAAKLMNETRREVEASLVDAHTLSSAPPTTCK
jgi:hypothetical protein